MRHDHADGDEEVGFHSQLVHIELIAGIEAAHVNEGIVVLGDMRDELEAVGHVLAVGLLVQLLAVRVVYAGGDDEGHLLVAYAGFLEGFDQRRKEGVVRRGAGLVVHHHHDLLRLLVLELFDQRFGTDGVLQSVAHGLHGVGEGGLFVGHEHHRFEAVGQVEGQGSGSVSKIEMQTHSKSPFFHGKRGGCSPPPKFVRLAYQASPIMRKN